ncbi:MAG: hypothetical protein LBJ18_01185 [Rickettsiales bacterium]|jgi:hypothetical protein|nr:hypothetical protein [Rickettsiales bacterium]
MIKIKSFAILFLFAFFSRGACADDLYPAASVRSVQIAAMQKCCLLNNTASGNDGANMQYLLKTIDICNNGTTNYGTMAQATTDWANTNAVDRAFDSLLKSSSGESYLQLPDNRQFNFTMDWGPGYKIEVKFKIDVMTSAANVVFYNNCYSRFGFMAENGYFRADYLNNEMKNLGLARDTNIHTVIKQDRNNWIDGVLYQNNNTAQTESKTNCPITIGAHGNEDAVYAMEGRIYYVKIWNGAGELLKHLVPMPAGATLASAPALYDILSDTIIYARANNPVSFQGCN